MYIKSLTLQNFKKHENLTVEFSDKLNILYGANDAGKSCVVEAIKWLFFNEGKDVRKEGTKKTIVTAILDTEVKVSKIKSASINAYELQIGDEIKRFDSVGKTIPDEIKDALQVRTINIDNEEIILNIADQITLPFLLGESSVFKSKLFNKLTGSNLIDKSLQSFNKDILKISRESKLELEHLEEQKKSLEEVTIQKDKLEALYGNFKKQVEEIKELQERYDKINELKLKLDKNTCDSQTTNTSLKEIKTVPDKLLINLKEQIELLEKASNLLEKISKNKTGLENVEKELSNLKVVDVDTSKLRKQIDRLEKLKELRTQLVGGEGNRVDLEKKIKAVGEKIIEGNKEYREILKKYGKCPTCKSEITDNVLKEITLWKTDIEIIPKDENIA